MGCAWPVCQNNVSKTRPEHRERGTGALISLTSRAIECPVVIKRANIHKNNKAKGPITRTITNNRSTINVTLITNVKQKEEQWQPGRPELKEGPPSGASDGGGKYCSCLAVALSTDFITSFLRPFCSLPSQRAGWWSDLPRDLSD